jgi:hypothetical protein
MRTIRLRVTLREVDPRVLRVVDVPEARPAGAHAAHPRNRDAGVNDVEVRQWVRP